MRLKTAAGGMMAARHAISSGRTTYGIELGQHFEAQALDGMARAVALMRGCDHSRMLDEFPRHIVRFAARPEYLVFRQDVCRVGYYAPCFHVFEERLAFDDLVTGDVHYDFGL